MDWIWSTARNGANANARRPLLNGPAGMRYMRTGYSLVARGIIPIESK